MGTRVFLFLILLIAADVFACGTCHKPHYASVGTCAVCHRGADNSSRENIAHNGLITSKYASFITDAKGRQKGEKLINLAGCRRCHTIGGKGESAAANLDISASSKTGEYLDNMIKTPNAYMPDFMFKPSDRTAIIKYLLFMGSKEIKRKSEPYTAYIVSSGKGVFEKRCGSCHKLLARHGGGRGTGKTGPNLSGLFSEYFRSSVLKKDERWTDKTLIKWIKNPRSVKPESIMPPQALTPAEIKKLLSELRS